MTVAESAAVIGDLRRARRRQRVAAIHWVDALYQVYITGLLAIVAVVALSGLVGDQEVSAAGLADVKAHGPALLGLLASVSLFMGLRSGSRGGPLALEQPDVRHVLLSPVDRGVALRGPALRQLRFLLFTGAVAGAAAGQLAVRRLPGNPLGWMLADALFGAVVIGLGFGSALLAGGLRMPRWLATIVGLALIGSSAAHIAGSISFSPGAAAGQIALLPIDAKATAAVAVVAALAAVLGGLALVSGMSLEAAERRTALVGQLRFAVTLQDLRTVLVLRRQLAQERPRTKPWIPARSRSPRFPIWYRGVRSLLRWPVSRIVRVLILVGVAGMSLRGAWTGTTPLLILAGLALWIAALDAVEPLGQEIDHPGRTDGFPIERGELFYGHLPIVALVSGLVGLLAGAVAAVPVGEHVPVQVALVTGVMAGLLAGGGAVVSVIQGAPNAVDVMAMTTPEIAGMRNVIRAIWPPGMAVLGTLVLLPARAAFEDDPASALASAMTLVVIPLAVLLGLVAGWARFHDDIHEFLREMAEQMSPTKVVERAAAEREALEASRPGPLEPVGLDADDDAAPKPKPKPKPKPPAPKADPVPGVQGGKAPKPMGRRRDQQ